MTESGAKNTCTSKTRTHLPQPKPSFFDLINILNPDLSEQNPMKKSRIKEKKIDEYGDLHI